MISRRYTAQSPTYEDQKPLLTSGEKKGLAIGGAAVGIPGLLAAKGAYSVGIPARKLPGNLWGKIRTGNTYALSRNVRAGVVSTGKNIASMGPPIWKGIKGVGYGLIGKSLSSDERLVQLNAKLDDLIRK